MATATTPAVAPLLLDYKVADRTLAAMHASPAKVRVCVGPRGSTKSSSALMEIFRLANAMPPGKDGVRRSRALFVRASYPAILKSMLPTSSDWLSRAPGFHARHSTPPTISINTKLADGTTLDFEILFMSLPDTASLQGLRGVECSFVWADEFIELPLEFLSAVTGSMGRYPSRKSFDDQYIFDREGRPVAPYEPRVMLTTNPGAEGSEWHKWVDNPTTGVAVFGQGGAYDEYTPQQAEVYLKHNPALAPHAIERFGFVYLPSVKATFVRCISSGYTYWADIIHAASDRSEVLTLVCSRWATSKAGMPVWPNYSDDLHLSKEELEPIWDKPLVIGIDHSGLHAAAVIGQMVGNQLCLYESLSPSDEEGGMSFAEFLDEHLLPAIRARYQGMEIVITLDPAISRDQLRGRTVMEDLLDNGLSSKPASSNNPKLRIDSVAKRLMRKGGIVVSRGPHTEHILRALRGGHHYPRAADGTTKLAPAKKASSHPADALTYLSLYFDVAGRTSSSQAARPKLFGKPSVAR